MVPCRLGPERAAPRQLTPRALPAVIALAVVLTACGDGGRSITSDPSDTTTSSSTPSANTPITIGIICPSPVDAATTVVNAWTAGSRGGAARCATPDVVAQLFARSDAGLGWTFQGCGGPDPGVPICTYASPSGSVTLTAEGSEARGWTVTRLRT
jgi:hypothetical protein